MYVYIYLLHFHGYIIECSDCMLNTHRHIHTWSVEYVIATFAALRHYSEKLCHGVLNLGFYSGFMNFGSKVWIIFELYKFIMVHN